MMNGGAAPRAPQTSAAPQAFVANGVERSDGEEGKLAASTRAVESACRRGGVGDAPDCETDAREPRCLPTFDAPRLTGGMPTALSGGVLRYTGASKVAD